MQKNSQKLNQRTASPILRNPKARYPSPILRNPKARYPSPILRNTIIIIKKDKKFKPSSISQGSSLTSFKPVNIKNLDKDKLRNLGDKDKLDKFPENFTITTFS